ncbi:MAG: hypothetical protein E7399_08770 [Ruminococcaceae bacterium]|nr:hypothetical protein [Oscillospiraceae bacterium]
MVGKRLIGCLLAGAMVFLTGCFDNAEVSDELYAIMIGLDKSEEGIKLSLILPVYGGDSGEGQQQQSDSKIFTVEADNVYEGLNQMHLQIARGVSLLHVKAVVFSEELAKEGVSSHLSAIRQHMETRNVMGVLVTKSHAEDYLTYMQENVTGVLSQELEQLLFRPRKELYFPIRTFEEFCRDMESDYGQTYAVYCKSVEEKGELYGTALFRGDKMVELLDKYQSACTMMVRGEFQGGTMTAGEMVADINARPRIRMSADVSGEIPRLFLTVNLQGGFMEGESPQNPVAQDDEIAEKIQAYFEETAEKTRKCGSDVWGFGKIAAQHFTTIQDWKHYNWNRKFQQADIQVKVNFKTVKTEVNKR